MAFALTMVYFRALQPIALRFLNESLALSDYLVNLPSGEYRETIVSFAHRNETRGFAEATGRLADARQALDEAIQAFAAANIGT